MPTATRPADLSEGVGIDIKMQNGPLMGTDNAPNGAFVEDIIEGAIHRLEFYQGEDGDSDGRFRLHRK